MNMVSDDISDMLVADTTLGLTAGTNLFKNKEPATPNNTVTIYDTPSAIPRFSMDGATFEYPSIQIRVRNIKQSDAKTLINNIYTSLHCRSHELWNGAMYEVIYCSSGPALLDWDDNNRCRLIINFNIQRRAG